MARASALVDIRSDIQRARDGTIPGAAHVLHALEGGLTRAADASRP